MGERVTQAELARRLEVSRQAIHDLIQRGLLQLGSDGKIDSDEAAARIAMSVHPGSKTAAALGEVIDATARRAEDEQKAVSKDPEMSFHIAKTMRELAEAKMAGLKLRQMQDELGPRQELDRQMRTAIVRAREFLMRRSPRVAMLMDGKSREQREEILSRTFETFLHRLATWQTTDIEDESADADA